MSSISLDTLQVAQYLLLYLHDEDGGDPSYLGNLILVDLIDHLVVQGQNVLQLVIRYPRLENISIKIFDDIFQYKYLRKYFNKNIFKNISALVFKRM